MANGEFKTFWDIEKEKTWRIYFLFGFLLLLYFVPIFILWVVIKLVIYIKIFLKDAHAPFMVFGFDTWIVLSIAAIATYIHWYYSNARAVNKILHLLGAKPPDKRDRYHYVFQNVVDEIEAAAGGLKVERYVLPTGAMNAFALADWAGRTVIGVTEGLISRLSRGELQSVVAHEMAHIVSNDCLETTITCSLFGIYSEALEQYTRALSKPMMHKSSSFPWMEGEGTIRGDAAAFSFLPLPILIVFFITDVLSQLVKMFMSREREYRADASAVKLTRDPLSLATALYKIGTHWRGAGYGGEHLAPIFILSPKLNRLSEQEDIYATLFSTHPPLAKRLQVILGIAHSDLGQIVEHLQKKSKIKTELEKKEPTIEFFAEYKKKWLGPFTLLQLQSCDWLAPDTKLKMGSEMIKASDVPALNHYFQIRKEPLWQIKRLCPICRQWLIVQEYEGLNLWRCAFCNGLLVEYDKLPRIFVRKEKGFTEHVQHTATLLREGTKKKLPRLRLLLDTAHPRNCPRCGQPMRRKLYSYAFHVEIDECRICRLIWFDADELEILQCLIEMEEG